MKAFTSNSLDINTSLDPAFFQGKTKDEKKSCCCLLTFIYPLHMHYIPMADFNIENIVPQNELKNKQTALGFTETELLLPKNFSLKVIDKIPLKDFIYLDKEKEKKFVNLTLLVCDAAFNLNDTMVNNNKYKGSYQFISFIIQKYYLYKKFKF